ncbi:MAG: hypothetical protein FWG42_11240 [Clostridiales bacterium]|nr:hypothetical protein [Clostridiales bacterium]
MLKELIKIVIIVLLGIGNTVFCMFIALLMACYQNFLNNGIVLLWILYGIGLFVLNMRLLGKICVDKAGLPFISLLASFALTIFLLLNNTSEILANFTYEHHFGNHRGSGWITLGNWDALFFYIMLLLNFTLLLFVCIIHNIRLCVGKRSVT